jgi:hypothetical protein
MIVNSNKPKGEFIKIASDMLKYVDAYCAEDSEKCILTIAWDGKENQLFGGGFGKADLLIDAIHALCDNSEEIRTLLVSAVIGYVKDEIQKELNAPQ